jgi:hemolysin III
VDVSEAVGHGRDKLYTAGEEIAHALTHGIGIVLAIAGLTVMVARATLYGNAWHIVGAAIFGATLVLMYTASTLYHSIPGATLPRTKQVLRVVDHSSIYLLIAGSYTPFTLVTLNGPWGWALFGWTWGLALAGVVFKVFATGKFEKASLAIYLGMGWCIVLAIKPLVSTRRVLRLGAPALPPRDLARLRAGRQRAAVLRGAVLRDPRAGLRAGKAWEGQACGGRER